MLSQDQRLSPKGSGASRQGAPSGSKIRWPSLRGQLRQPPGFLPLLTATLPSTTMPVNHAAVSVLGL